MENEVRSYEGIEKYYEVVEITVNKIYNTARKSGAKAIQPTLKEELRQAGMVALLECWNNYDKSTGASFKTFSYYRVKGALLDYLRGEDTVSRSTRASLKLITHNADDNTFSSDTLNQDQIDTAVKRSTVIHQFGIISDNNSEQETTFDVEDTTDKYTNIEALETVKSIMKRCPLTEREQYIINNHYFLEQNLYDIGAELGITESRVSQIHKECLGKMKQYV